MPDIPPWIDVIQHRNRTSYECVCGILPYHKYRCPDFPKRSEDRFTYAKKEIETWIEGIRTDPSSWYWSRRLLLWILKVHKLTQWLKEHQFCQYMYDECKQDYIEDDTMKLIKDPVYLKGKHAVKVQEHQVPGLISSIKEMVVLCKSNQLKELSALEVDIPLRFFIVESSDPNFDIIFNPEILPIGSAGAETIQERSINGRLYWILRWKKVKMYWSQYDGEKFQNWYSVLEGDLSYLAQKMFDRLDGIYLGSSEKDEEVIYV